MSKSLESLLSDLEKADQVYAETEALKPKLEAEINSALESGDVLDEKIAASLQTKRAQLELIPAKLAQVAARQATILEQIESEFTQRLLKFEKGIAEAARIDMGALRGAISNLGLQKDFIGAVVQFVYPKTKSAADLARLKDPIEFLRLTGRLAPASQELLKAEKSLKEMIAQRKQKNPAPSPATT